MRGLPHALIGAGCGAALAHLLGGEVAVLALTGAVGSQLPDVDLAWGSRRAQPIPGVPCRLLEHRGPTHSLLAAFLICVLPWPLWLHQPLGLALGAGYASHLLADSLSPMGQPYLWPFSRRRF